MIATKWIQIGSVKGDHSFMCLNWGVAFGLQMRWRGGIKRFQSFDFFGWPDLLAAIRVRLAIARLELVAIASAVNASRLVRGVVDLVVLVMRRKRTMNT
jgi:fatty acid desaturase